MKFRDVQNTQFWNSTFPNESFWNGDYSCLWAISSMTFVYHPILPGKIVHHLYNEMPLWNGSKKTFLNFGIEFFSEQQFLWLPSNYALQYWELFSFQIKISIFFQTSSVATRNVPMFLDTSIYWVLYSYHTTNCFKVSGCTLW